MKRIPPSGEFVGEVVVPTDKHYSRMLAEFIVFNDDTMNKFSDQELADKNIYDKFYSYSYEQLKAMNFKIVYDGE